MQGRAKRQGLVVFRSFYRDFAKWPIGNSHEGDLMQNRMAIFRRKSQQKVVNPENSSGEFNAHQNIDILNVKLPHFIVQKNNS